MLLCLSRRDSLLEFKKDAGNSKLGDELFCFTAELEAVPPSPRLAGNRTPFLFVDVFK